MSPRAYLGAAIFDGEKVFKNKALSLEGGRICGICDPGDLAPGQTVTRLDGGVILPGFVDLQVNGGGGVMFNDDTSASGLATIAAAHAGTGTRALLPTLITDTPERSRAAVTAVAEAVAAGVPGVIGLHLEGPHLAVARKGAHDPDLIRRLTPGDEDFLIAAAGALPNLKMTLAPESVTPEQIARLTGAGILVSLGHSDCTLAAANAAIEAGATCVTHLFNAMSPLGNREPGLVGAALASGAVSAGLIADGIHVHRTSMALALAAKQGPGEIFLVTDAMSTVGSEIREFRLNGRRVLRRDGRLTLEDGTLAGADLEMPQALKILVQDLGVPLERALAMATTAPARLLRDPRGAGRLIGARSADVIHLQGDFSRAAPLPGHAGQEG